MSDKPKIGGYKWNDYLKQIEQANESTRTTLLEMTVDSNALTGGKAARYLKIAQAVAGIQAALVELKKIGKDADNGTNDMPS